VLPRNLAERIRRRFWWNWQLHIARDPVIRATREWQRGRFDETLRLDYPLSSDSVVLDVGGYRGDWTRSIVARYQPHVYVFEPVPEFFEKLEREFSANPKVRLLPFALGDRDYSESISLQADGSSLFRAGEATCEVMVRDIRGFLDSEGLDRIDLVKINIEGGEFRLLRRMLDTGIVPRCRDIQVQFHTFYPGAEQLRAQLRDELAATHDLTYDYLFVWENWRAKEWPAPA
jgi:FkbM family methyltransferase